MDGKTRLDGLIGSLGTGGAQTRTFCIDKAELQSIQLRSQINKLVTIRTQQAAINKHLQTATNRCLQEQFMKQQKLEFNHIILSWKKDFKNQTTPCNDNLFYEPNILKAKHLHVILLWNIVLLPV